VEAHINDLTHDLNETREELRDKEERRKNCFRYWTEAEERYHTVTNELGIEKKEHDITRKTLSITREHLETQTHELRAWRRISST
jgi:hypothetical protein